MLFNSHLFLFVFLPLTLAAVFGLGRFSRDAAKVALFVASLAFYAFWDPRYTALLLTILVVNYATAEALIRLGERGGQERLRALCLALGLSLNLGALGYFKYTNLLVATLNGVLSHKLQVAHVILPLGISFITFQKVAFLVDVYSGAVARVRFIDYCLFVTFFPQLIAGPIVHHRDVIPQFERPDALRPSRLALATGVTLFTIGLCKKVLLADAVAPGASAVFAAAAAGSRIDLLTAWSGALLYLLELYYDFSGYSDMAVGLGLLFGVNLPYNFNSPYKALGFVDYWQRWHITLTRFLTAYIYNPLSLRLTRRWIASGRRPTSRGRMTASAFAVLLALPTLFTMFISGLWHGAGLQFIVFGLLHGVFLVLDHGIRTFRKKPPKGTVAVASPLAIAVARALTLLGVAIAAVFFRADSVRAALRVLAGMAGLRGLGRPEFQRHPGFFVFVVGLALATQLLPNAQEVLGGPLAALRGEKGGATSAAPGLLGRVRFQPSLAWGALVAGMAFAAVLELSDSSVFLYFNF